MSESQQQAQKERNEIDAKVLAFVKKYHNARFNELVAAIGMPYRKIDHSLQRLKKAKKLQYDSKSGWNLYTNR